MGVTTSARDVAATIRAQLGNVDALKLHKLLYYCQGYHLAMTGEQLFGERISAWDHGPVVGELWKAESMPSPAPADPRPLDEAQLSTVGYVLSRYGAMRGADLVRLTHAETPWREADNRREPGGSEKIPLESMRDFFEGQLRDEERELGVDPDALVAFLHEAAADDLSLPGSADSLADIRRRLESA